jgi:hypothetical protein
MANAMQMRLQISSDVYFPSWAKLCQVSCSNSPVLPVDALEEVRADHPRHQTTRPSTVVDLRSNKYPRDAALIDASSMWIPCKSFGRFKSDEGAGKNRFLDEQMCINHRIEPWLPTSANSFQTLTSVPTIGEAVETGRSFSAEYRRVHAGYVSDYVSDCVMIVISSARSLWTQPSRWKCHDLPGHHAHRPAQDSTAVNLCSFTVSYSVIWCHTVSYSVIRCRTVSYGVIRCHSLYYREFCHQGLWLRLWIILGNDIRSHHILGNSQRHTVCLSLCHLDICRHHKRMCCDTAQRGSTASV